jgi:DNA polymerase I
MAENTLKKLFLLDAYALIYRSYYAFIRNPQFNSKGVNTSAMLGFTNSLVQLLETENPHYIGVVFDVSAPTFRHAMYQEYKAKGMQCLRIYGLLFLISAGLLKVSIFP